MSGEMPLIHDPINYSNLLNEEIDVLACVLEIGEPTIRRRIEEKFRGKYGWGVIQSALTALVYHNYLKVREEPIGEYTKNLYYAEDTFIRQWTNIRFTLQLQFQQMIKEQGLEAAKRHFGERRIRFYLLE